MTINAKFVIFGEPRMVAHDSRSDPDFFGPLLFCPPSTLFTVLSIHSLTYKASGIQTDSRYQSLAATYKTNK